MQLAFLSLSSIPAVAYLYTGILNGRYAFTVGGIVLVLIPFLTASAFILSVGLILGTAAPFFFDRFFHKREPKGVRE